MKIYSIFDLKSQTFADPFVSVNDETLARELNERVPPNHTYKQYPDDFLIYSIADWDQETGEITDLKKGSLGPLSTVFTQTELPL